MYYKSIFFLTFVLIVEVVPANFEPPAIISDNDIHFMNKVSQKNSTELRHAEKILCRNCGSDASSANSIISKFSPASLYKFNDTLFNKESVLVQVVSHDYIFKFPVITFNQSTCVGFGKWEVDNSWFPGYQWQLCVCPDCTAFLGWIFKPIHSSLQSSSDEFFSLILTSLIGESCNYILFHITILWGVLSLFL